jgi:hypothetical protein
VKHLVLFRLLFSFGDGAAVVLAPACKAQSEISPDHFDGTDSWAAAAQKVHAPVEKGAVAKASLQAKSQKTDQGAAFELAAAREIANPVSSKVAAADPKRKSATRKPEKH